MSGQKEKRMFFHSVTMGFQPFEKGKDQICFVKTLITASVAACSSTPSATTQIRPSFGMVWDKRPIMLFKLSTMPSRSSVRVD